VTVTTSLPKLPRTPEEARSQASAGMNARLERLARYGAERSRAQGIKPGEANRIIHEERGRSTSA